jgi:putative Holliday junction resolvase
MALDYGDVRIGVAVTDTLGMLAQPLETISSQRPGDDAASVERIAVLVGELEVARIVVGLPLGLSGRAGPQADKARAFGERVAERTGCPVEFFDERWSSVEAERILADAGVKARKRKGRVDPIAAALILRAWLERSSG